MKSVSIFLAAITATCLLPRSASAQPRPEEAPAIAAPRPAADATLAQGVIEALAADGVVLSRLGVTLQLEPVGDRLLISLIDAATGRAVASTRLDAMPAEPAAAIAAVAPVVIALTRQLVPPVRSADDPRARARAAAEYEFRQQAIGFSGELFVWASTGTVHAVRRWSAHRGELREPLAGADFYRAIERPDLEARYRRRRAIMWTTGVGSLIGGVASIALMSYATAEREDGAPRRDGAMAVGIGLLATSSVAFTVSCYLGMVPHPIGEGEAKRLAGDYNRRLRARMGLPVRSAVQVTPYATAGGGGLSLGGRF